MSSVAVVFVLLLALSIPLHGARHLRTNPEDSDEGFDEGFHGKVNAEGAEDIEGEEEAASGGVRSRSLVRASRDVPHGGGREGQPEFYVDYVGPRTHSPSHN
ncbi:hypothetical protein MUK42_35614 [Musa troglodytarum]|uniref:Uncharacterized protein n=1 Tax=Musa troglodytarum TaxID=320322 RepID=A0A9E7K060_9LILI|nr:hypothetical protein MUK42_35614 [Musa troglodytarum]